jgi:FAD/FMN-containing dehydrogenase
MLDSWHDDFPTLQKRLAGPSFTSDTPGYADEVAVFNETVSHRPAVVVGAVGAADVGIAVDFAAEHGMDIAVLNTGHGPSVAAGPTTLMITTKRMSKVEIDADTSTARVEAGVRFGQLVEAAAAAGLAPLPGSAPGVGVVGYTLAGGASATMGRRYGWAADHVRALDVVTADGRFRRVTPSSDADLFSALLGGKGNFGVVTAMEFALFPVTRLYAGALFYSGDNLADVLSAYLRFTVTAPDEMTTGLAILNFPPLPDLPPFMQGKVVVAVRVSYVGTEFEGARLIEPLRQAAPVLLDTVTDIPFTEFASISADPTEPAAAVEHFGLLRELPEDAVNAIVEVAGPQANSRINLIDIRHLQGAYSRQPTVRNAVGARDAAFAFFALTVVPPGLDVADYQNSGREFVDAVSPWLHHMGNPSFQGPADASESATARAYDRETYQHLQAVKAKFDPYNRFRTNHNIPPEPSAA